MADGLTAMVAAIAMVIAGLVAAGPALAAGAGNTSSGPVSNAFALGGNVGGTIDERTGAFEASLPLVDIAGRDGQGLELSLGYDQSLAATGQANRFGLGAGWVLGIPFVDTVGGIRLYPASGGSYAYQASSPTGLAQYPLRDLKFVSQSGTVPARQGLTAPQSYSYVLTTLDGTVDRFDIHGNLVEQVDRFGNEINLTWQQVGSTFQPTSVVDNYGQVTTFTYLGTQTVQVTSPPDASGHAATITLSLGGGRLATETDALGQKTSFLYQSVSGAPNPLLSKVVSPTGAQTNIAYTAASYEPGLISVSSVAVTDADGNQVIARRTFSLDPPGTGNQEHNYTGYPTYNAQSAKTGTDALFASGSSYQYMTSLSDGHSTVLSTYNSLHLLVRRQVEAVNPAAGTEPVQSDTFGYPKVVSTSQLPPNYGDPTSTSTVIGNPAGGPTRTTTTSSAYNDDGQQISATDATGATTTTTYDPRFGVPTEQKTTAADGATEITSNTLTDDGKAIESTSTAVGSAGTTPKASTVDSYTYDQYGEVTSDTLAWAPGAAPTPDSGPDKIVDTTKTEDDPTAHTQTVVSTTAAGTPDAATTTTVSDLVTGEVLRQTDPDNLTTSYTYDVAGRVLNVTAPGGAVTRTTYPNPTTTLVTSPSGLATETTTDVIGRTLTISDNVSGDKLVTDPTAQTISSTHYAADGTTLTSTAQDGATTTTTFDAIQRPIKVVQPTGLTQTTAYDDGAGTTTTGLVAAGAATSDPTSTTVQTFNAVNQLTRSQTSYPDHTPQTPTTQAYDGLGRVDSASADGLTATPSYGAGGDPTSTSLTPSDPSEFPGPDETASTENSLTGSLTAKTLTPEGSTGAAATPTAGTRYTYDAAGRVATATTPEGATTSYTYTANGQIATVTAPSGTVTTNTYQPSTGWLSETDIRTKNGDTQKTAYTYYADTGEVHTVSNPSDPSDTISYDYDPAGNVIAVHYPGGVTTSSTYNDKGQLATATDATGAVTTYGYDADGRQTSASQVRGSTKLADVSYTYDAMDRVHTVTRGNGDVTTIGYDDASQVTTETTADPDGTTIASESYAYDPHGNITSAVQTGQASDDATTTTTTTSVYHYDAYNRLTSSAVYPNATGSGTPTTTTSYSLDSDGNVTGTSTTSAGKTSTTSNTITADGELTGQDVDGTTSKQTYDADGNVTTDLVGNHYTYDASDQLTSVTTPAGVTTDYGYWPDGSRRDATTTVDNVTHTTSYYYGTDNALADDSYTGGASGTGTVTASYLVGLHREARTLDTTSGTTLEAASSSGSARTATKTHRPPRRHQPPHHGKGHGKGRGKGHGKGGHGGGVGGASGASDGTGYYLLDAHGSVTALAGTTGQVATTYRYGDYGQPDGADPAAPTQPAADPAGNAAVNPFTYDDSYTDPTTGIQILPARNYDPAQGRFLSADSADQLNRYLAFDANPIMNTDPTGEDSIPIIVTDVFATLLFAIFAVVSFGALAPEAAVADAGVITAGDVAATTTAQVVGDAANAVSGITNLGATATSMTLTADDVSDASGNGHFLSDETRDQLSTSTFALGLAAGLSGGVAGAAGIADAAGGNAADALATATEDQPVANAANTEPPNEGWVNVSNGQLDEVDVENEGMNDDLVDLDDEDVTNGWVNVDDESAVNQVNVDLGDGAAGNDVHLGEGPADEVPAVDLQLPDPDGAGNRGARVQGAGQNQAAGPGNARLGGPDENAEAAPNAQAVQQGTLAKVISRLSQFATAIGGLFKGNTTIRGPQVKEPVPDSGLLLAD